RGLDRENAAAARIMKPVVGRPGTTTPIKPNPTHTRPAPAQSARANRDRTPGVAASAGSSRSSESWGVPDDIAVIVRVSGGRRTGTAPSTPPIGDPTMTTRIETDTLGEVEVPDERYWGAQTQRSLENFDIGGQTMPREIVMAFAQLKKAAALVNADLTDFPADKANAIAAACDEILAGDHDDEFPLVVVANRATELLGGDFRTEKLVKANDDVNKSQSSNDTFPTAMHIAVYDAIVSRMLPNVRLLHDTLAANSTEFMDVVKTGRTHLMDATPVTLGQEFSGYAMQLQRGMEAIDDSLVRVRELALGGTAVGTGLNTPEGYDVAVAAKIAELTGHPFVTAENKFESLSAHDAMVEISGALKRLAVSLMHIANNIRMLASGPRTAIGEIVLPANEP
ncbi:fumC, partial [Symbiodinium sp. KB8]